MHECTPDNRRTQRKTTNGFTLVEVVAGIALLSLALMYFASTMGTATLATEKARFERIAAIFTHDWLNKRVTGSYGSLFMDADVTYALSSYYSSPLPNATLRHVVRPFEGASTNYALREVEVTIAWSDPLVPQRGGSVKASRLVVIRQ